MGYGCLPETATVALLIGLYESGLTLEQNIGSVPPNHMAKNREDKVSPRKIRGPFQKRQK